MTNNKPFQILLDCNDSECFHLFCVIKSLCNYPSIDDGSGFDDFDGKLYASAFSFICSDYLVKTAEMYPHEDFEQFVEEMEFHEEIEDPVELARSHGVEYNGDFEDVIFELIKKTRTKIVRDIKLLFPTEQLQLSLFASICRMGETKGYEPSNDDYLTTSFLS